MKPRRQPDAHYPGYTIRVPEADKKLLNDLSDPYRLLTLNRLLSGMVAEIVAVCLSYPIQINPKGLLMAARHGQTDLGVWQTLAQNDFRRSVPYEQSKPIKVTFAQIERAKIASISRRLRWSEGQVIMEATQAFFRIASAAPSLQELPDIIRICRGEHMISSDLMSGDNVESSLVGELNLQLGLLVKPNVNQQESQSEPLETDLDLV